MTSNTPIEAARRSLSSIDRTDGRIKAWSEINSPAVTSAASELASSSSARELPLYGITVGVKDIFDVADMRTQAGFLPFASSAPAERDAIVVQRLRDAGALIVGKTVTTQFAVGDPPETRNPWNIERTPGGSSSGSAAAVAAGHVDLAIGSQTTGSTLRPAAFCGVYGLKPSFGWISRIGMFPLAPSLDHVGLIARSIEILESAFLACAGPRERPAQHAAVPAMPRIGVWRDALSDVDATISVAFDQALDRLRTAGANIRDLDYDVPYEVIFAAQQLIFGSEGAAVHDGMLRRYPNDYAPKVRAFVEVGSAIPAHAYVEAQRVCDAARRAALQAWTHLDAVILPTASTTAPTRESTGNTALQAAATLFGLPAVSSPAGLAADGLPWGIQLVAPRPGTTADLLLVARWCDQQLPNVPPPPAA